MCNFKFWRICHSFIRLIEENHFDHKNYEIFNILPFISFQSLVLAKNSTAYKYFINPPLNPQLRVHIFNYTNAERFLEGKDKKLILKDVGPYVYTERTQKVDVVYNDNNTISYRVPIAFILRTTQNINGVAFTMCGINVKRKSPYTVLLHTLCRNQFLAPIEQ